MTTSTEILRPSTADNLSGYLAYLNTLPFFDDLTVQPGKLVLSFNQSLDPGQLQTVRNAYTNDYSSPAVPDNKTYRVYSYVNEFFLKWPHQNIDFRRHTKSDVAFQKTTTKNAKKRPVEAEYSFSGTPIAKMFWTFTDDLQGFMVRRQEEIAYYQVDGNLGPRFLKKDQTYSFANPVERALMVKERQDARKEVMDDIRIDTLGILTQLNPGSTPQELYAMGDNVLKIYKNEVDQYNYSALTTLETALLEDTYFDWLKTPVAPGVRFVDLVVNKLRMV